MGAHTPPGAVYPREGSPDTPGASRPARHHPTAQISPLPVDVCVQDGAHIVTLCVQGLSQQVTVTVVVTGATQTGLHMCRPYKCECGQRVITVVVVVAGSTQPGLHMQVWIRV